LLRSSDRHLLAMPRTITVHCPKSFFCRCRCGLWWGFELYLSSINHWKLWTTPKAFYFVQQHMCLRDSNVIRPLRLPASLIRTAYFMLRLILCASPSTFTWHANAKQEAKRNWGNIIKMTIVCWFLPPHCWSIVCLSVVVYSLVVSMWH
jgi:hypothetical protein